MLQNLAYIASCILTSAVVIFRNKLYNVIMYIHYRPASACYKLAISIVATILIWCIFASFGWSALRLFPVWVLLLTSAYYLVNAAFIGFNQRRDPGRLLCPMLEGMLIVSYFFMLGMAAASYFLQFSLPLLNSIIVGIICGIMPVMTLLDWILFSKKGRWHVMGPFYWLALPVCYAATMIFTASFLPNTDVLKYPLAMFNYVAFDPLTALWCAILISIIVLIAGYALYLIDFTISGQLAKKVVLPHLVVVDD